MNLFGVMEVSATALGAERLRAEVVTSNLANAESTRTPEGGPYRRREVVFSTRKAAFPLALASAGATSDPAGTGVQARAVENKTASPILRYEPSHPDANAAGYVAYPNINPAAEMADLMGAARAYEMNISALTAAKQMIQQSIEILK